MKERPLEISERDLPNYDESVYYRVIGKPGSGASSLISRYMNKGYSDSIQSTAGLDFDTQMTILNKKRIRQQIWDMSGAEPLRGIRKKADYACDACILVFDLTDAGSLDYLREDIKILRSLDPQPQLILVGTKLDEEEKISLSAEDIHDFATELELDPEEIYFTSAKTGEGVTEVFDRATVLALAHKHPEEYQARDPKDVVFAQKLISDLTQYIERICPPGQAAPNFSEGFLFLRTSRALSREVNYYLALELRDELQNSNKPVHEIMSDLATKRANIAERRGIATNPQYVDRGINSKELNDIIKKTEDYQAAQEQEVVQEQEAAQSESPHVNL